MTNARICCLAACLSVTGCLPGGSSRGPSVVEDSVLVSWDRPESNDDGSNLDFSTVSGYRIYWSPAPGACDYPEEVFFVAVERESVEVVDLLPGTHYFQVSTVLHDGTESVCSVEVFRSIGEG